jgi:3-methyladenine DNA glycosylase AlkD
MPPKKQTGSKPLPDQLQAALVALESRSTDHDRQNLVKFAINPAKAFGVSMANLKVLAKQFGRDHELAATLWESGWYEARLLASLIDDPTLVTPAQMDRWCRDFDNWGICDTVCFALFDRTPHAWAKVTQWSKRRAEFEKRAGFALLWGLTVHDKHAEDGPFVEGLASSKARPMTNDTSSRKPSIWPCARSANVIATSTLWQSKSQRAWQHP